MVAKSNVNGINIGDRTVRPTLAVLVPAVLLPAVLFAAGCRRAAPAPAAPEPVPVRVRTLAPVRRPDTVAVSGQIVSPAAPAQVAFLVGGRVVTVGPREGDLVRAGQVLATLDAESYALGVDAAAAQAGAARIAAERAADEYARMKQLYESKSLAPNDFLKFEAARDATRRQAEQAQAAEKLARKNLADATLVAPRAGFVARRAVEPGDMAAPGRPVFEIVQLDPVEVSVGIPEKDVERVRAGGAARVVVPALAGAAFEGTVRVVNVAAEPATRSFMVRVGVPNPEHRLRIGMIAELEVRGAKERDVLVVPADAIVKDAQGATLVYVYFPDQEKAWARRVEPGAVLGDAIEIRSGLAAGEAIVVAGQQRLADGVPVAVQP